MAKQKSKGAKDAQTIAKLIEDIDITMFTTIGPGGYLVSRPLSTQQAQFDGTHVWFFVASDSPKVAEITRDSKVNLAYASKGRNTYVSLAGDAYVNNDPEKIEAFWNDALKAYFPRGVNDPKLTLIEVEVHTAEYWDGPGSLIGKAIAFAVARVTKREEAMGENRIVDLRGSTRTSRLPPSHADAGRGNARSTRKTAAKKAPAARKAGTSTSGAGSARSSAKSDAKPAQATTGRPATRKAVARTAAKPQADGASKRPSRKTAPGS